jgi:hypothetical protein
VEGDHIVRPTCLECAGKHLAQACELLKEKNTGYPMFRWYVIGQLAEAEEETVRRYPDLANEIREYRVSWFADNSLVIPFEELLAQIDDLLESAEPSAMDDASETKRIDLGEPGTGPDPTGEFGQTEDDEASESAG